MCPLNQSKTELKMFAGYNFEFSTSGFYLVEYLLNSCRYFLISLIFEYILMVYSSQAIKFISQ